MGALATAAKNVETAWCKGNIRDDGTSRDDGDRYCAIGALASALIPQNFILTLDGLMYGPMEDVLKTDRLLAKEDRWSEKERKFWEKSVEKFNDTYRLTNESDEILALAEVINANYPDRSTPLRPSKNNANSVVYSFNDHDDTTREDVIAMMEKADQLLEDRVIAEDKTADELVAEIDELVEV